MSKESELKTINYWIHEIQGLPLGTIGKLPLEENVDIIRQWHVFSVLAKQLSILFTRKLQLEHDVSTTRSVMTITNTKYTKKDRSYMQRFVEITGLMRLPWVAELYYSTFFDTGTYRPFLLDEHIIAIKQLYKYKETRPALQRIPMGFFVSAIFHNKISSKQLKSFGKIFKEVMSMSPGKQQNVDERVGNLLSAMNGPLVKVALNMRDKILNGEIDIYGANEEENADDVAKDNIVDNDNIE